MKNAFKALVVVAVPSLFGGCGNGSDDTPVNALPAGFTTHSALSYPATTVSSGNTTATQDLLTAGIGKTGLGTATAPAYADPLNPTSAELRRNAIHSNYRAILDPSANGGYGTLYGPNIDASGVSSGSEGLVPGKEYLASLDDGSGSKRVVVAVQIPSTFDPTKPCIVAGPSSGSRGVYGSIGSA
ncbi:MAG: hydrogenase, partial [Betaproteobacteria bacterium]|nr:hydrogenase [Betaproteobacteria bacterium]